MDDLSKLTPEQLAFLQGVSDPRSADRRVAADLHRADATAASCSTCPSSAPPTRTSPARWPAGSSSRTGRAACSCPRLRASPSRSSPSPRSSPSSRSCADKSLRFIESHPEMPEDAKLAGRSGRQTNLSRQQGPCRPGVAQRLHEGRGDRPARLLSLLEDGAAASAAISPIARRFSVSRAWNGVKGLVLGRYRMTSRLEKQDTRRWFLPVHRVPRQAWPA